MEAKLLDASRNSQWNITTYIAVVIHSTCSGAYPPPRR